MSPIIRPAAAVIAPIAAIVTRMPTANSVAIPLARAVLTRPWPLMKPTISGRLARWHGLRIMLRMPQMNDAPNAIAGAPSTAWLRLVNSCSISGSLALAELARLGNLLRRELHLVRQRLGDRDLPARHRRARLQPLLQVGFAHE